ncbi:MAG TPA: DUF6531 domain-containing protein [Allosphingosinicella sp.]|nr:DUF6531 domain-containing protein [Allosphingosinicella sp.]
MSRRRHAPQGRTAPALGLTLLSLLLALFLAAPASAQYEPPKQMTLSPLGVDLTKGRFSYKTTDLSIGPFTLERSYLGGNPVDGSNYFGPHWTHNYAIFVITKDPFKLDGVYVVLGRGVVHFSHSNGNYSCWNPDCDGQTLAKVGGAFVYTDAQGNVYTFSTTANPFGSGTSTGSQRVARIDYADGHTLSYIYSGQQLRQIASNYGYSLVFDYAGSTNSISKACGYNRAVTYVTAATTCAGAALAVSYSYGASNVTNVVDVMGQNWGYDYGVNAQLTCVRQVNSSACQVANVYSANYEVGQQTTADGAVWNYNIQPPDPEYVQNPGDPPPTSAGNYTGPEGINVWAEFSAGLLTTYNHNGRMTGLQWDGLELARLTHPEGNNVRYSYRGGLKASETWEAKPNSGVATVAKWSEFPDASICPTSRKTCNKPVSSRDYKGNQTDYTYEPHGGVKTETGPAVNGIRPQVRYEYALRRAWVSNGAGHSPEAGSIYLPSRKAFCATGAASGWGCAIAGDEVVTTYDYGPDSGPNNLTLRSETVTAGGVSRKTCYGYDWQGNQISTTRPSGNCQ